MQVALHSDEQGQQDVVKRCAPNLHTRFTGDTNQHRHLARGATDPSAPAQLQL